MRSWVFGIIVAVFGAVVILLLSRPPHQADGGTVSDAPLRHAASPSKSSVRRVDAAPESSHGSDDADTATADELRGWVIDGAGRAVRDATVRIQTVRRIIAAAEGIQVRPEIVREATTDADGRFTLPLDDTDPTDLLIAQRAGCPEYGEPLSKLPAEPIIVLEAGATLTGVVRSATTGAPLPNASLTVVTAGRHKTTTDAGGRYRLPPLVLNKEHRIEVALANGQPHVERITLTSPGEQAHDIVIATGPLLSGRAFRVDLGDPVPDAEVLLDWNGVWHEVARTAADGTFHYYGVAGVENSIRVRAAGFVDVTRRFDAPSFGRVHEFPLLRAATIRGRVEGPRGESWTDLEQRRVTEQESVNRSVLLPISESPDRPDGHLAPAEVPVIPPRGIALALKTTAPTTSEPTLASWPDVEFGSSKSVHMRSELDGTFVFDGLNPYASYEVVANDGRRETRSAPIQLVPAETRDVLIRLPAEVGRIAGRVLLGGLPAAAAIVSWQGENGRGSTRSDRDGHYVLDQVDIGVVEVSLRVLRPALSTSREVTVTGGQAESCMFDVPVDWAAIRGRVVDGSGAGIGGVAVSADPGDGRTLRAVTESSGAYTIAIPAELRDARFNLSATQGTWRSFRSSVAPGSVEIDFTRR